MLNGIVVAIVLAVIVTGIGIRIMLSTRARTLRRARETFSLRREWLEAEFVKLAASRGLPRGLAWADCDFEDEVQFARERASGQLRALVAVTIRFEAIEGGGMEDVEAVGNLRAATALFLFDRGKWTTSGQALFNLNPAEAIQHYRHELEMVD